MIRVLRLAVPLAALVLGAASASTQPAQPPPQAYQQPPPQQQGGWGQQQPAQPQGGGNSFGSLQGSLSGGGGQPGFGQGGGSGGNLADQGWDLALNVPRNQAEVQNEANQITFKHTDQRGALSVSVMRNDNLTDLRQLAESVRTSNRDQGDTVSDMAEQQFLGHSGFQWLTANKEGFYTLVLMSHRAPCVYFLVATSKGTQEEMVAYFQWTVQTVGTVSGGPASGQNCR